MKSLLALFLAAVACGAAGAQAPPSRPVAQHEAKVLHLAAASDGSVLVTATEKALHAWDTKKEKQLWKAPLSEVGIDGLAVGGELVACAPRGLAVAQLFELESGKQRTGLGGPNPLDGGAGALVVDPKDRWIWLGTQSGTATRIVPDNVNGWSRRGMGNGGITSLALDAKGKTLVVGGSDGTLRFVGAKSANRDEKKVVETGEAAVTALGVDPKGSWIVAGCDDGCVGVWKASSGKRRHELDAHASGVVHATVDPRGKRAATADLGGEVRLWDLASGEALAMWKPIEGTPVAGLAFVDKGKALVTASGTELLAWDLSDVD
ncbi:MAG: hypothetical protein AAF682_05750 [Planctomycetota bacterium]